MFWQSKVWQKIPLFPFSISWMFFRSRTKLEKSGEHSFCLQIQMRYLATKEAKFIASLNPLTPGNFAKKCLLKRVKLFLGRCQAKKNRNCAKPCLQVEC